MASPRPPQPPAVRVRVPAKINLALCVGRRRADGYHPLATVFHAVSLYDEVLARPANAGVFRVQVSGEGAKSVPAGEANLAVRGAKLLATRQRGQRLGVALEIRKSIPVEGGLAGGSADGAAALLACSVLWDLDVADGELEATAAQLGSDVPFLLLGGTAVGTERGESLVPALARGTYHWVLAFGHGGLSTPAVYRRFDKLRPRPPTPQVPTAVMNALRGGDPEALGRALINDLQPAALDLQPQLQRTLDAGLHLGALGAVVSGSGPTVAFLVRSEKAVIDLAAGLSAEGVCRAVRPAMGPVPGARVIG
jgi:4-diphosphocytidyl-2-C-methyl-D-erythritol kinase